MPGPALQHDEAGAGGRAFGGGSLRGLFFGVGHMRTRAGAVPDCAVLVLSGFFLPEETAEIHGGEGGGLIGLQLGSEDAFELRGQENGLRISLHQLTMTDAGATFPYGQDPMDSNIRIAPSVPSIEELQQAIAILCLCLRFTALEQLLKLA